MISIIKNQNDNRYQINFWHKMEDIIFIMLFTVLAKCNEEINNYEDLVSTMSLYLKN